MSADRSRPARMLAETRDHRPLDAEWIASLCAALRVYLEREAAALSEEIRNYPRPIARCDDQLTGLLERRAETLAQLQRLGSLTEQDLARADCVALAAKLLDAFLERPAA